MTFVQVKSPNLNVAAQLGWCLAYVQNAFGLGWTGDYALDGWSRNKANHANRDIPSGVYVPVWFDGYWTGIRYGHVVVYKDGTCYSSPWTADSASRQVHDTLGSIADVERIYRMTYLGWSEDMNGQRVIKIKEANMLTTKMANILWRFYRGDSPSAAEKKQWVGKVTNDQMAEILEKNSTALIPIAAAGRLNAQNHLPAALRKVYKAPTPGYEEVTTTLYKKT